MGNGKPRADAPRAGLGGAAHHSFFTDHGRGGAVRRGLGVAEDLGVGVGLGVAVAVAVGVAVAVAVGVAVGVEVGVGVGPDSAQYLPPVLVPPPQTIISLPVHTAV